MNNEPFDTLYPPPVFTFRLFRLGDNYSDTGGEVRGYTFSFSLLTINADSYPLLRRMHKLGDEKRSLVIVPRQDYGTWLGCREPERTYLIQQANELLEGMLMPIRRKADKF